MLRHHSTCSCLHHACSRTSMKASRLLNKGDDIFTPFSLKFTPFVKPDIRLLLPFQLLHPFSSYTFSSLSNRYRIHIIESLISEAISDCAQGECRTFKSYLSVCVSVNHAARCTLHVLSAPEPIPLLIGRYPL